MKERSNVSDEYSSGGDSNDDRVAIINNDDDDSSRTEFNDLVPLSVEALDYTDDIAYQSHLLYVKTILIESCGFYCNRRYLVTILFIFLCLIGSILLVLSKRFHQSVPNLLRIGDKHSTNHIEPVCLPTQLLEEDRATVENMNLNRVATAFYDKVVGDDNIVASGFLWNDDDAHTSKWRPQGVTTMQTNGFRFALISWYGRADEGYADRGGRVSFVNVTDMLIDDFFEDMSDITLYNYRHVLLVDENFCTLPSIHVGGIEYQNGTLHVADSRKGEQAIIEFDVANDLYEVPSSMTSLLGYRYVLRASSSFHTPIKPSFFSYDIDNHKFIVGTYAKCGKDPIRSHQDSPNCFNQRKNKLLWCDKSDVSASSPLPCEHYFPEMQGAVSMNWENKTVVWTSSSYGAVSNSHLHTFKTTPFGKGCPNIDLGAAKVTTYLLPAGLEDLHIEEANNSSKARFMWMQTEFGVRQVFAVTISQLL